MLCPFIASPSGTRYTHTVLAARGVCLPYGQGLQGLADEGAKLSTLCCHSQIESAVTSGWKFMLVYVCIQTPAAPPLASQQVWDGTAMRYDSVPKVFRGIKHVKHSLSGAWSVGC